MELTFIQQMAQFALKEKIGKTEFLKNGCWFSQNTAPPFLSVWGNWEKSKCEYINILPFLLIIYDPDLHN